MKKKVVVGMSGGVDSSVAAYLLKEQGYEVVGVTMRTWEEEDAFQGKRDGACCGSAAAEDAGRVAYILGIPHYVMNFKEEFREKVVDYFIAEYLRGRTPNPCIACNRYVKWEALLKRAMEIGADYIATGHYARVERLPNGRLALRNSVAAGKDQTYALYNLTQFQLSHTLMPVGDYTKEEIRALAEKAHLPVAAKPDSQDICFVPDKDYAGFIERMTDKAPGEGNFVAEDGTVLGTHKGIIHYTVGQRKGLGLSMGRPVFVSELRPQTNEVVISDRDVYRRELTCNQINFMGMEDLKKPRRLWTKVRYAHRGGWCTACQIGEDEIHCTFEEPVRAVTPGQAVVFYDGEYVMGGGVIR
ncbi:MAG: tRNA 2-thiouridine(34) synthase MnmA [Clostridium sp.]|nr:tRNA 2-thiouridine(34) synthase MnmA [Clostridium sp.]